jgi:hypothetical protein
MTRRIRQNGFVLLMTLGLIGLAAIALAGFARHSLALAVEAQDAQAEAQRRWGEVSCRRMLLGRAEEIFQSQSSADLAVKPSVTRPPLLSASFALGSQQFDIVLADENAKVNVNTLLREQPEKTQTAIHQLMGDRWAGTLQVHLSAQPSNATIESWGQVFDMVNLPSSASTPDSLAAATTELTCWGDGRLNVRRASDASLRTVGGLVLKGDELADLLKVRQDWPDASLDDLLRQSSLRAGKLAELRRLLSDQSDCHSLWVHVQRRQRRWSNLQVAGGGTGTAIQSFTW